MTEHDDNFLHHEEPEEFLLSGRIVPMPKQPPLIVTPTKAGELPVRLQHGDTAPTPAPKSDFPRRSFLRPPKEC